jgi:hypothetical protein
MNYYYTQSKRMVKDEVFAVIRDPSKYRDLYAQLSQKWEEVLDCSLKYNDYDLSVELVNRRIPSFLDEEMMAKIILTSFEPLLNAVTARIKSPNPILNKILVRYWFDEDNSHYTKTVNRAIQWLSNTFESKIDYEEVMAESVGYIELDTLELLLDLMESYSKKTRFSYDTFFELFAGVSIISNQHNIRFNPQSQLAKCNNIKAHQRVYGNTPTYTINDYIEQFTKKLEILLRRGMNLNAKKKAASLKQNMFQDGDSYAHQLIRFRIPWIEVYDLLILKYRIPTDLPNALGLVPLHTLGSDPSAALLLHTLMKRDVMKYNEQQQKEPLLQFDHSELKLEVQSIKKKLNCVVCSGRERCIVVIPCYHLVYCRQCFDSMSKDSSVVKCSLCNTAMVTSLEIKRD